MGESANQSATPWTWLVRGWTHSTAGVPRVNSVSLLPNPPSSDVLNDSTPFKVLLVPAATPGQETTSCRLPAGEAGSCPASGGVTRGTAQLDKRSQTARDTATFESNLVSAIRSATINKLKPSAIVLVNFTYFHLRFTMAIL